MKDPNVGDKVTYLPCSGIPKRGIVKEVCNNNCVRVVFNCAGDWDNYKNYTGVLTHINELVKDWR